MGAYASSCSRIHQVEDCSVENRTKHPVKVLIMGAAGRDFHNFNVAFRDKPEYEVIAFTAAQIPNIANRTYPPELAGRLYPTGIPIHQETDLERLIATHRIDQVVFAYSDVSYQEVMRKASRVIAVGADFRLFGAAHTMLRSGKPVIAICAVRTGAGKSPLARKIAAMLRQEGFRVAVVRHPMPYGDLSKQVVQRFSTLDDLRGALCTIEEREEYEPHIRQGIVVYAGVDYGLILRQAETEADVILWDGGNNDTSFVEPDLNIVVIDPHRAGHERSYVPGEVNLLRADVIVLTKLDTAEPQHIEQVRETIRAVNPTARVVDSAMPISVEDPSLINGKRVLVIEDGPTVTHGGMSCGAGVLAARKYGAAELIDPRPYAVGSLRDTFEAYPHLARVLPAMGYGPVQIQELEDTINRVDCDLVLIATPVDLGQLITVRQPTCHVTYEFEERGDGILRKLVLDALKRG